MNSIIDGEHTLQDVISDDYYTQDATVTVNGKTTQYYKGDPKGLKIYCRRYGNVVCVSCGNGNLQKAHNAVKNSDGTITYVEEDHYDGNTGNGSYIAILPEAYRPPALLSVTEFKDNSRVRIMSDGRIQCFVSKANNANVIFTATYIVDDPIAA